MISVVTEHADVDGTLSVEVRIVPAADWAHVVSTLDATWAWQDLPGVGLVVATRAVHSAPAPRRLDRLTAAGWN